MTEFIKYGIDLGTTNSCIATCVGAEVRVFQSNEQMNVTPSAVRVLKTGRMVVGQRAYAQLPIDPDNTAIEFKRWMGQKNTVAFPAAGRSLSAEELSAEVLKSLCESVQRQTGESITAAVVTVPAAFGALQCEATARAARLAGLEECPLLQEPIAAAIAYGAAPGAKDQRWLVFDLGGGTLDVAVVSTRSGRLTVLEHRGNNLLGGKDVDRKMAESLLLPVLASKGSLPRAGSADHARLLRRLAAKAEEAKIALSTSTRFTVNFDDLEPEPDGRSYDGQVDISRAQLEELMQPLVDECIGLSKSAIDGARLKPSDLDRILLVGGPTQIPLIRSSLAEQLNENVDFSLDPMTVVARGAALYAASIERTPIKMEPAAGTLVVRLAYDPVSASLQCPIAGRVEQSGSVRAQDIKLESDDGFWTSDWVPLADDLFDVTASLQEQKTSRFWLYARDGSGRLLEVEPGELSIRHGLVVSSPPLPHTISVEISGRDGQPGLDTIFPRNTPLPSKRVTKYRASHALRPREPGTALAIKLWEGEELADPEANDFLGNMLIASEKLHRAIPEGAEIELSITIDESRHMFVEAFIPHLDEHFAHDVYVPQREEKDFAQLAKAVGHEVDVHRQRLEELEKRTASPQVEAVRKEIEGLARQPANASADPDQDKRVVEQSRKIRIRIGELERSAGVDRKSVALASALEETIKAANEVVSRFGSSLEKKELDGIKQNVQRAGEAGDERSLEKLGESVDSLRWRVLFGQDWFWKEVFQSMQDSSQGYLNPAEAMRWLAKGNDAILAGDGAALRDCVRQLWKLQTPSQAKRDQEKAIRSGLSK